MTDPAKKLQEIIAGAQLPALPQSAIRLLELSQDPENGPAEFAVPIEADPGLTGQVLRFVNSSYFGFSRETFYTTLAALEAGGVAWLCDGKAGRPGPLKMTDEAIEWVRDLHRRRRNLSGREIAEQLAQELGIEVHRRTIERLLGAAGKKND